MRQDAPRFFQFPLSHFCEKGLWALDHFGEPYRCVDLVPAFHIPRLRRLGVATTTLPILEVDEKFIQGSSEILDHLEHKHADETLEPLGNQEDAAALEAELDRVFGEGIRRIAYFHLLDRPDIVVPIWAGHVSPLSRAALRLGWSKIRKNLRSYYKLRDTRVEQAHRDIIELSERLEKRLESHAYLGGERFSRLDVTAAALFSPVIEPLERPWSWPGERPDELVNAFDELRSRPIANWARRIYRDHRNVKQSPST